MDEGKKELFTDIFWEMNEISSRTESKAETQITETEDGVVYTVEGNSGDACKQRSYAVGSSVIYGYGMPSY